MKFYREKKTLLALVLFLFSFNILATPLIRPSSIMNSQEINLIHKSKSYFNYKKMDDTKPIWMTTKRRYGHHYLNERTKKANLDQVLEGVLTKSFSIQYKLHALYQAKLGIHSKIGDLLPKISFQFGKGVPSSSFGSFFSSVFGFLSPSNWMQLINQRRAYKIAKMMLKKSVLDDILSVKLLYLKQHQEIQKFEILNFYFIHLQLLTDRFKRNTRIYKTLMGSVAVEGTKMSTQRAILQVGFNDLTKAMGLDVLEHDHTADKFNISDIKHFPSFVQEPGKLETHYQNKNIFLKDIVKKSIELKIAETLHKMSQLNVGITATSGTLNNISSTQPSSAIRFGANFGYGTLPNILIAKSQAKVAKVDVKLEFLNLLDTARRSFDLYTNSLGSYTQAIDSLKITRDAFKSNLDHFLTKETVPDAYFIRSVQDLIESELILNNALHGSLRARAHMDRLLLIDNDNALKFLPGKEKIVSFFDDVASKDEATVKRFYEASVLIWKVRHANDLKRILYKHKSHKALKGLNKSELVRIVTKNMDALLKSNIFSYKRKKFFSLLNTFIQENKIDLEKRQASVLKQKINSFRRRAFKTKNSREEYLNGLEI